MVDPEKINTQGSITFHQLYGHVRGHLYCKLRSCGFPTKPRLRDQLMYTAVQDMALNLSFPSVSQHCLVADLVLRRNSGSSSQHQ